MANPWQLPFPEAIAFFRAKKILPTNTWKDVSEAYSAIAFTITSITRLSLLADIQEAIAQQLEKGISPEAFREIFQDIVTRKGWNPNFSPYRVNLILSQNVRTAYSYGRWQQQEEPAFKQRHPYRQWVHRDSVVPREHHLQQHLKVYPADANIWKAIAPPPFGCKCTFYSLSQRQLEKEGLTLSTPPLLEDIAEPGFTQGFPQDLESQRKQLVEDAIKRLPDNLKRILEKDMRSRR